MMAILSAGVISASGFGSEGGHRFDVNMLITQCSEVTPFERGLARNKRVKNDPE